MPVKSSDGMQKLYFITTPDGTMHECTGVIETIETTSYDEDKAYELSFRITDDMNRRIFHVALMMLPNNFRRMHGLPLKRRIKRRRKR